VIPLHRPVPLTAREQQHSSSSSDKEATKLIYFDGRQHHVVDAPEGHQGPKSVDKNTQVRHSLNHGEFEDNEWSAGRALPALLQHGIV
jgi:hypothetical protein